MASEIVAKQFLMDRQQYENGLNVWRKTMRSVGSTLTFGRFKHAQCVCICSETYGSRPNYEAMSKSHIIYFFSTVHSTTYP